MIGELVVKEGYATKLERLKRPIKFHPGLNILFGPNGCGKSTTLKIAAAYCSIKDGGWSSAKHSGDLFPQSYGKKKIKHDLPYSFFRFTPGKCKAELEWDGSPALFADSNITDQTTWSHFFHEKKDSPDGMSDIKDQIAVMFGKPSAGILRMNRLVQYYKSLEKPPDLTVVPKAWKGYNSLWLGWAKKFNDYIKTLPRTGPVTLMLDEPDRSLSIENQMLFWTRFIPTVAAKYQVIVATHCVFALATKAHWIEFESDYLSKSLSALKALDG